MTREKRLTDIKNADYSKYHDAIDSVLFDLNEWQMIEAIRTYKAYRAEMFCAAMVPDVDPHDHIKTHFELFKSWSHA